jgi:hypothetical protein
VILLQGAALLGPIVSVILERPTCLICVSNKVGASRLETLRSIERMGKTVSIKVEYGGERCRACGSTIGPIYSIPASTRSPSNLHSSD